MYGRFPILTDEHISYALVKALREAGWPIYRVEDEKALGKRTPDARVFAYAAECGWVWLSRDARALRHARDYLRAGKPFRGMLVWAQDQPMSIGEVMRCLDALAREEEPFAFGARHVRPGAQDR